MTGVTSSRKPAVTRRSTTGPSQHRSQTLGYSLDVSAAFCWRYGDINCSGAIEGGDVLAMLDFRAGIEGALPSGYPRDR